ncbi:MAG: ABC transporter ATP-binding protein [Erysipelotrichaceae bacterium]|nr:ABC transporter ATP-binding protein [Erysipelotrichaceae bacterium]
MRKFKEILKVFKPYIAPYKWGLIGAILMVVLTNVSLAIAPSIEGLITTQLVKDVTGMANGTVAGVNFKYIIQIILILLVIYSIKTIAQILSAIWLTNSIQSSMKDLRNALQNKIRKLPVRYFDSHQYGDILSKITNDVDTVSNALQQTLTQIISGILGVTLALTMMLRINPYMTIIAFMIIPLGIIISSVVVKHSQKRFKAQQDALGKLNGAITEMYTGYNEIMLYNQQDQSIEKFKKINEELKTNAFKAQFMSSIISPLTSLFTYLAVGSVGVVGTILAIQSKMQVGNLQAFIRYIWQINEPISQVSQLSAQIQSAMAASYRIYEILIETEEVKEADPSEVIASPKGNVTFEHVKFGYYPDKILIQDFNVEVKSGQMVAIVGPTGAGKTTLINLLLRFYDVLDGSIKIDGVDIRSMKREDLRQLFGMVLQDTWLFSGTIFENLRYGRLDARKDEVIEAAKLANVHHFIRTLPDGYDMMINEDGSNISQGEKQLLTIARAILKNPKILILDEATSSVDTRLEKMLSEAMHKVMEGRTSFVIAHRLSTIKKADLILVINDGNIVEQGTHEELLAKKGYYESLYNSQFASMNEDA